MPYVLVYWRGIVTVIFWSVLVHGWDRVRNDTMAWFQSLSAQVSSSHIFRTLGIPASSGLAIGLVAGLAKSPTADGIALVPRMTAGGVGIDLESTFIWPVQYTY